uniref:Uncharacterized protein n=1 Tax=Arundo donax TaxID=35708 RepID=A0A0A9EL01_ARUDO
MRTHTIPTHPTLTPHAHTRYYGIERHEASNARERAVPLNARVCTLA